MSLRDITLQDGVIGALVAALVALAGLLGLRAQSKVRADNAQDSRQSRYEDRRDKAHDEMAIKLASVQDALIAEREKTTELRRRLREQSIALQNALETLLEANPREAKQIQRWVSESTFAAFDERPAPPLPRFRNSK